MAAEKSQNIQDVFLNTLRKKRIPVTVFLSNGVKLSGVSEKGPAGVAGVLGGDVIVGLGGKNILNIYDYTDAMADLKVGKETTITVLRNGEEMTLKLTPGSRD